METATMAKSSERPGLTQRAVGVSLSSPLQSQAICWSKSGAWIDVIPLVDPQLDKWDIPLTGRNAWRIEQGDLIVGDADDRPSKLLLPIDSDFSPGYECEIEFTRRSGALGFNLNIPTPNGDSPIYFDPPGEGGVFIRKNWGKYEQLAEQTNIKNGERRTVRIQVQSLAEGTRITVLNDDHPVASWLGDLKDLPKHGDEGYPHKRRLSLWIQGRNSVYAFHRIRLRLLDGATAQTLRPAPKSLTPGWHGWPADAPAPAIAPFDAEQAKKHQEEWAAYLRVPIEYTNSIGMKFRLIPPGEFLMGSTAAEIEEALPYAGGETLWEETIRSEGPQHRVRLTQPFYLGVHEVTQSQFANVTGSNPARFSATGIQPAAVVGIDTSNHPGEGMSWKEAVQFCRLLSKLESLSSDVANAEGSQDGNEVRGYQLPSEAQWEFACRAGTTGSYNAGETSEQLSPFAWFSDNSDSQTHAVGSLNANAFGFYDLHGNVWEWVRDNWDPAYFERFASAEAVDPVLISTDDATHMTRGGNWSSYGSTCRSASRCPDVAAYKNTTIGFRVSLSIGDVKKLVDATKTDGK